MGVDLNRRDTLKLAATTRTGGTAIRVCLATEAARSIVVERRAIDMAFNNAGIQVPPNDAAGEPIENFRRIVAVKSFGVWASMEHELRVMRAQGSGAIVNDSSLGGLIGLSGRAAHHGTKHAAPGTTKSAGVEYAPRGIGVNAACPGDLPVYVGFTAH